MDSKPLSIASLLLVVCACSSESSDESGSTASVSQAQTSAFTFYDASSTAAVALLTPFGDEAQTIAADHPQKPDGPVPLGDSTKIQTGIEASGASSCVTFVWGPELSATATFDQCDFSGNGVIIDGTLSLSITFEPATIHATFSQLAIADNVFDGSAAIAFTGSETAPQTTLSADMTLSIANETATVSLSDATVQTTTTGSTVNGLAALGGAYQGSVAANDAYVVKGDCHPSSGQAELSLSGAPNMTVFFLPTTPLDGKVDVLISGTTIAGYPLLAACP